AYPRFIPPGGPSRPWQLIRFRHFIDGSLALASLNRTCRDHCPDVSAALTTVAFDQSGPRWLGISDLIAEPEGPTFISYKVARSRLNRLRFVTQDPERKWRRCFTERTSSYAGLNDRFAERLPKINPCRTRLSP